MRTKLKRVRKKQRHCVACEQPIPRSEPDAILEDLEASGKLYFHERCALDAYKAVVAGEPSARVLTHRHINPEAN